MFACGALSDVCTCQKSSSPGELRTVFIVSASPPFFGPLFMIATRGRSACTITGAFD